MWEFDAIGTHWKIQLPVMEEALRIEMGEVIKSRINEFDQNYSRFRPDSLVSRMAEKADAYDLPVDAEPLFDIYRDLYIATDGAVTPLIGQMLVDAGYDATYSLQEQDIRPIPSWSDSLDYSFPRLEILQPALLDLGAAGKGYLVDLVAGIIESRGVTTYMVDAGGDIRVRTEAPEGFRVGLEHPEDPAQVIGVASLTSGSICGSAGNRRAWGRFNHIFRPDTRESIRDVRAVWVTADEARVADGISTALFFVDPELLRSRLSERYSFEYLVLYPDYSVSKSDYFPAELFLLETGL